MRLRSSSNDGGAGEAAEDGLFVRCHFWPMRTLVVVVEDGCG